jgi:hypothetical protein
MADPRRLKRAALSGWFAAGCALGVSLFCATHAFAAPTVSVTTSDGVQGGSLTLTLSISLDAANPVVASTDVDLVFDTSQIQLPGTCSNSSSACQANAECGQGSCVFPCQLAARLTQQTLSASLPTTVHPPDPAGHSRLRLIVFDDVQHPNATFDGGVLATCTFQVLANAQPDQLVSLVSDPQRLVVGDSNDTPILGVQIQLTPGRIRPAPTATPTSTPQPTPTPTIVCFFDHDCPRGQVCVDKSCHPAPTPTPTIACVDDTTCPDNLKCVSGVCRDLSTPTPTPTPLPKCTTDAQCLEPGTHCRAGVCVPTRECTNQNQCRGVQEACTNGNCECGGDCNLDGFVLSNEITRMICVLNEKCMLAEDCPAGDFDGDGHIMANEICQAVSNLGLGCPGEGQPLVFGLDRTNETRSLDIGSASGIPGQTVTITVGLSGVGDVADVATSQLDLIFDTAVLDESSIACTVDQRLTPTDATFTFLPQTPPSPTGKARLRLFVGDTNLCKDGLTFPSGAFSFGPLLTCQFRIDPLAPLSTACADGNCPAGLTCVEGTCKEVLTAERLNVGDPRGDVFGAVSMPGTVTVNAPPPCPPTVCPEGTHCRAGVCKGVRQCSGPTAGANECLNGREACINQVCECAGDCPPLDGRVRNDELTTLVNIFTGHDMVSSCPATDINGDDRVRNNEVTAVVLNFQQGCQ